MLGITVVHIVPTRPISSMPDTCRLRCDLISGEAGLLFKRVEVLTAEPKRKPDRIVSKTMHLKMSIDSIYPHTYRVGAVLLPLIELVK